MGERLFTAIKRYYSLWFVKMKKAFDNLNGWYAREKRQLLHLTLGGPYCRSGVRGDSTHSTRCTTVRFPVT